MRALQFHTFMKYFHEQFILLFFFSFCCLYCHLMLWHRPFVSSILVCIVAGCGQIPIFLLFCLNDFSIFYEILAMMLWGVWGISFLLSVCRLCIVFNVWLFYLCTIIFILGTAVCIETSCFQIVLQPNLYKLNCPSQYFVFFLIYPELPFAIQAWSSLLSLKFISWLDYLDSI